MGGNTRRGFLLKHRVTKLFRRVFRNSNRVKSFSRFINWSNRLKTKAKAMIVSKSRNSGKDYIRVGQEPEPVPVSVPKGHMAVYVGTNSKEGDFERILVPVVYINHPLFGDLLKETEKEFGYDHPGGITIPCKISEFERVQTRIKAVQCSRKLLTWKRSNRSFMVKS